MIHVLKFLKGIILGVILLASISLVTIIGWILTAKTPELSTRLLQELSDDLFN